MSLPPPDAEYALYRTKSAYVTAASLAPRIPIEVLIQVGYEQFDRDPVGRAEFQILGKSCSTQGYDVCRMLAHDTRSACLNEVCISKCSMTELQARSCNSLACCECFRAHPQCAQRFAKDLQDCEKYLCGRGELICKASIESGHKEICRRFSDEPCGGICYEACRRPKRRSPVDCQCYCPTTCAAPHINHPSTCACVCPRPCPPGMVQDEATCKCNCLPGLTDCGDVCRNLETDRYNCGQCGEECFAHEDCCGGVCVALNASPPVESAIATAVKIRAVHQPERRVGTAQTLIQSKIVVAVTTAV